MKALLLTATLLGTAVLAALTTAACSSEDPSAGHANYVRADVPTLYVSTPVLQAFAARIVGEKGKVVPIVGPDEDPATWTPTPEAIRTLQAADRVVLQGAAYEEWAERVSLPSRRTIRTADAVREQWIRYRTVRSHSHGDGEVHEHDGVDGHTWMDPALALAQATRIHASLLRDWPEHKTTYDAGLAVLAAALTPLDARLKALPALPEGTHLHTSQPVYGYLAARLGWPLKEHDLAPNAEVDDYLLEPLKLALNEAPGTVMLWHAPPSEALREGLAERLELRSLVVDPCLVPDAERSILQRMEANLTRLERWLE